MMYNWIKTCFYALLVMSVLTFVLPPGNTALAEEPVTYCPDGMLSYWKLDETACDRYVDSYGGNDGLCCESDNNDLCEKCPATDTGIIGGGQLFDGENTEINVPADATLNWGINDSFSIEFWMKRLPPPPDADNNNNEVIVGRDVDNNNVDNDNVDKTNLLHWWVGVQNKSGSACFVLKDSSGETIGYLEGTADLANDVWHHVVAVRNADEDQIFLYVDGELVASADTIYNDGFASMTAPLNIGHLLGGYHFDGMIDDVALYDKALSSEEITQRYDNVIIVEDLYAHLLTDDEKVNKKIKKAIEYIQDNLTLCKNVKKVFDDSKKAVKTLMSVDDSDILNTTIYFLVSINERLAQTAIDQAIAILAIDCDENDKALKEIADAEREMDKAEDDYDTGKYDKAIAHYKKAWTKVKEYIETSEEDVLRIMPLGNSITLGYGSSSDFETDPDLSFGSGYRSKLETGLLSKGYAFDFVGSLNHGPSGYDNDHEGHGGWEADEIAFYIYQWLKDNPAEVVLLHIGTNDIGGQDVAGIAEEINLILDRIDRYEKSTDTDIVVILARIINRVDSDDNTTALNIAIQDLADARNDDNDNNIVVVDMENALAYPADMSDSVHPNDDGYANMADVWLDAILDLQLP